MYTCLGFVLARIISMYVHFFLMCPIPTLLNVTDHAKEASNAFHNGCFFF